MKKIFLFSKTWHSTKKNHIFSNQEEVAKAREYFLNHRPSTLFFLLEKRHSWMNFYIKSEEKGIEVGCGTGLSKLFIKSSNFKITDFVKNSWVDEEVDALNMPFKNSSLDYIIANNVLHHIAKPYSFINECSRVLRKGGRVIIQDVNASLLLLLLLRINNHEEYSFDVNVFDETKVCNNPEDPWSCNIAIPNLLFDDIKKFEKTFPFKIIFNKYKECLLWPLSGGIAPVGKKINLSKPVLTFIDKVDSLLITISKDIFALQMQIVLENIK